MTTIELITTGARSGEERAVRLYAAVDDDALAIVGSSAGRPRHPAWVHNLRAHPQARVVRGRSRYEVRAVETHGAQRERLWRLLCAEFPNYERYQAKTDRRFAVFRLEPLDPAAE